MLGHQLTAMGADFDCGKGGSGLEHHGDANLFPQPGIGHAKDAAFGHFGDAENAGLDLGAIDVLTAAQDHVLLAIDNIDKAVAIDPSNITGLEPAIDDRTGRGIGAVDIALDHG